VVEAPHGWPLRLGLGATALDLPHQTAAMVARLDLVRPG
jgi:hypothetical protein